MLIIREKLNKFFAAMDIDHNGVVDFDEFMRGMTQQAGKFSIHLLLITFVFMFVIFSSRWR